MGNIRVFAQDMYIPLSVEEDYNYLMSGSALPDPEGELSFAEAKTRLAQGSFQPFGPKSPLYNPEIKTWWLKLQVKNDLNKDEEWVFEFPGWSEVWFYDLTGSTPADRRLTGHLVPFRDRDYPVSNKAYVLEPISEGDSATFLVRLQSRPDHTVKPQGFFFRAGALRWVDNQNNRTATIIAVLIGIMVSMFLYNLFVYFSTRDRNYIFYLGILLLHIYMTLNNSGYLLSLFSSWDSLAEIRTSLENFGSCYSVIFMLLFTINFLNTKKNLPRMDKFLKGLIVFIFLLSIASHFAFEQFLILGLLATYVSALAFMTAGSLAVFRGVPSAGYYLLAYSFTAASIIVLTLAFSGVIQPNLFNTLFVTPGGYVLEALFFSFALANKINILKAENEEKQERIIEHLRENEALQTKVNRELEHKVAERTAEIKAQSATISREKEKSEELLLNILPEAVAEELKLTGHSNPLHFDEATVLFTDFVHFTRHAEELSAHDLVDALHSIFASFDEITTRHGLEKIKTIGDAYMVAGGIPIPNDTHPRDAVAAAFDMLKFMENWNARRIASGQKPWEMRVGIHTGPLIAGVVGKKKFAYDIWGDTVNLAARMESSSTAGKINISQATWERVKDYYQGHHRGKIAAKNKGEIHMYFIDSPKQEAGT